MSKFVVCEDCGSNVDVKPVLWDGKEAPLCHVCRDINGLKATSDDD
jgi:hypothetical protein